MNVENIKPTLFAWQKNLQMNLDSSRSQNGFIDQILSVRHCNNQDIIQLLNTVNTSEELVDNRIINV
jgi:hypothetical protein